MLQSAHPVSKPLLVVVLARGFDSLDGQVSGKCPTDKVGDGGSETEHVEEDQYDGAGLSVLSLILGQDQSGHTTYETAKPRTPYALGTLVLVSRSRRTGYLLSYSIS